MREIVLIAHDLRSTHNVGSLLRTADGFGVQKIYFTGYTPYPLAPHDARLPHLSKKIAAQIHKTALDAEELVPWEHYDDVRAVLKRLRNEGFMIAALEQAKDSIKLPAFAPPQKLAILLGREVEGIDAELLKLCDVTLEIPMFGHKESFNVVQAAAVTVYHCRFKQG